jgi:hypothetical protein
MNFRIIYRLMTIAAVLCTSVLAHAQTAQEVTGPGGMQIFATPYLRQCIRATIAVSRGIESFSCPLPVNGLRFP